VNLVLLEADEIGRPLPRSDRRVAHLLDVLGRREGEPFDAGVINGPRGKARFSAVTAATVTLAFEPTHPPALPPPLTLVAGLPRPQTARDVLRDATTLGVAALHFVVTERTDPGYTQSSLWSSGEWRRHVITGAEQAFDTRLPEVTWGQPLAGVLAALPKYAGRVALDNYEATGPLSEATLGGTAHAVLAVGGERGWGPVDRAALRAAGFGLRHLGTRVLRVESACVAALAIVHGRLGLM
jgi:RsmE family RNA methyltransferase